MTKTEQKTKIVVGHTEILAFCFLYSHVDIQVLDSAFSLLWFYLVNITMVGFPKFEIIFEYVKYTPPSGQPRLASGQPKHSHELQSKIFVIQAQNCSRKMTKHKLYDFSDSSRSGNISQKISAQFKVIRKNQTGKNQDSNLKHNVQLLLSRRRFGQGSDLTLLGKIIRGQDLEEWLDQMQNQLIQHQNDIQTEIAEIIKKQVMWPTTDQPCLAKSVKPWEPDILDKNLQQILTKNATLSLKQWAFYFSLISKDKTWTVYRVRKWFRSQQIKRKKVVIHKPFRRVENLKTISSDKKIFEQLVLALKDIEDLNQELIMVDECIFSHRNYQKLAWAGKYHNITQQQHLLIQPCLAVIGAASNKRGFILHRVGHRSAKSTDFLKFLIELRQMTTKRTMNVLLDNCTIHKTKIVREYCQKNNIRLIFNVPYKPQYNGIELVWALLKQKFRQELTLQMTGKKPSENFETTVNRLVRQLDQEVVKRCCISGIKEVFQASVQI